MIGKVLLRSVLCVLTVSLGFDHQHAHISLIVIPTTNRVRVIIHTKFLVNLAHLLIPTSYSDQFTPLLGVLYLEMNTTSHR